VTGTPDGVIAGNWPLVVVVLLGEAVGFTMGVELGFGVGAVDGVPFAVVVAALGFTIGLDVGFGFGFEFGFGVGVVVIGVPVVAAELTELPDVAVPLVAAAGLPPDELPFEEAELLAELFELFALLELVAVPLVPVEPELPPVV